MSAKWIRSKAWDDKHLTGPLVPVKVVFRALSSISLAVVLLILVAIYGVLASVPIGLIALIPTTLIYGATLVGTIAVGAALPAWAIGRAARARGVGGGARFALSVFLLIGLGIGSAYVWYAIVWPQLRYDHVTGGGFRLFAGFVDRYKATQLRRLPGVEMSELEFYAWWPLSLVLVLFVTNLMFATIRRIEFIFVNIGVLTVHTGIVVIALGSAFYSTHKQEGDVLLLSGGLDADGKPMPGRPDTGFYDNTQVALWITPDQGIGREQRRLVGIPRYNDYNLNVVGGSGTLESDRPVEFGPLDIRVPDGLSGPTRLVDDDVRFRVVGFASYCELEEKWVPAIGPASGGVSMREFHAVLRGPGEAAGSARAPAATWRLIPELPAERVASLDILNIEHTRGMGEQRWADLITPLPAGARHALIVEIPGTGALAPFREVYAVEAGRTISVGDTGYMLEVKRLAAEPPFRIITKGYEGAASSVAIVRITPPPSASGPEPGGAFERWVYHRFPEISQDLLDEKNERGMPKRRVADPAIRVSYIDASVMQVYVDERENGTGGTEGEGRIRVLSRMPGSGAAISPGVKEGDEVQLAPQLALRIGRRHESVLKVETPRVVPEGGREKDRVGNHQASAIALKVTDRTGLAQVRWVPFTQYLGIGEGRGDTQRRITLGDGRVLDVAFGRVRHEFDPPMSVRLVDFRMTPYPHTQTARDFSSELMISQAWDGKWVDEIRSTSLNEPLLVHTPFIGRADVPGIVNAIGRAASILAPNQYKFSQAGWDQGGWRESEMAASRGEVKRAFARFTILGVGNSPGIHIIATGAVLMSVGIPWAFYVKPWLLRRRKRRIQAEMAKGGGPGRGGVVPGRNGAAPTTAGVITATGDHP